MDETTNRQFHMWMHWIGEQWNHPGLQEHYMMVIIMILRQWWSKKPITFESCKLDFGSVSESGKKAKKEVSEADKQAISVQAASKWKALVGLTTKAKEKVFGKPKPKIDPRRR